VLALDQKYVGHTLLQNEMLASRLVMAPMTRNFSPEGVPEENVAQYYRKRAENGIGLIITDQPPSCSSERRYAPFLW